MKKVFQCADIMLPKPTIDGEKWSVVACDQFTSEPEYWEQVDQIVQEAPSSFRLILPEVYLESDDLKDRLYQISKSMENYLAEGVFDTYKDAMIYVERTDSVGKMRAGIVGCIDLEEYNYEKGSASCVRATESTVIERIPPRIKVRENAPMELPHIMILIDDQKKTVIEPLAKKKSSLKKLYDFDLMQKGGHLKGYLLEKEEQEEIYQALALLGEEEEFYARYNIKDVPVLLYAMGDGNHSLATAKEYYERLKKAEPHKDFSHHPARYALCELVNLHSPALEFEAIHRIVTNIDEDRLEAAMKEALGLIPVKAGENQESRQFFTTIKKGVGREYLITKPTSKLTVGSVQNFLDQYLKEQGGKIDYIHGIDVIEKLSMEEGSLGFVLPDMGKEELFPTVILDGALPRKTFSMGHAEDKRYYMECRMIR